MEDPKKVSAWMGIPCLAVSSVMSVGFWPPYIRYWFFILIGRREDEKKFGFGGGTAGSIIAQIMVWAMIIAGYEPGVFIAAGISVILGHACVGTAEAFLRWRTKKKSGYSHRVNHKGKRVTHDFNETCIDEMAAIFMANIPLMYLDCPVWMKIMLGLVALIIFRILDGKRKLGLAAWADQKVKGTLGCMADDYLVALQVGCIFALPVSVWQAIVHRDVAGLCVCLFFWVTGFVSFFGISFVRNLKELADGF